MTDAVDDLPMAEPEVAHRSRRSASRDALEWLAIVAGALAVAVVVKTLLIQAFFIPSLSMFPTLDKGDRVLVNKLSYRLHDVNRGDVVVFERPENVPDGGIKDLIKRVVAVSGDVVEARDGVVFINDRRLRESYVDDGDQTLNLNRQTIPAGKLFVMGDNRDNSEDSRVFGPIDEDLVVGRAFVTVWPLGAWDLL